MTTKKASYGIFGFFAVAAIVLVFFTTSNGINIISDSVTYLQTADNIVEGLGVKDYSGHELAPMIHFPPLYPLILSLFIKIGIDPLSGARVLNAITFAIIIFLVAHITYRASKSLWVAFFAGCFTLASSTAILIHSFVLTESSFIVFMLLCFISLVEYFQSRRFLLFFVSAMFAAFAVFDRYVGVTVVASCMLAILFWDNRETRERLRQFFLFGVFSMFPIGLWFIYNYLRVGAFTDRVFAFHPLTLDNILLFFATLSEWVMPYWHNVFTGIFIFVFIIVFLAKYISQRKKLFNKVSVSDFFYLRLIDVFTLFVICYFVFLCFSISFFDALTPLNYRMLAPLYFVLVIIFALVFFRSIRNFYFTFALGFFCLIGLVYSTNMAMFIYSEGLGFTSKYIVSSTVKDEILLIADEKVIYTNVPHMVYVLSSRLSYMLPQKKNPHAILLNEEYINDVEQMRESVQNGDAVILYILMPNFQDPRMQMLSLEEIEPMFGSNISTRVTDDVIVFYRE